MLSEIREMLRLQDSVNTKINTDWINAGHQYSRAILVEAVEAIDHVGWKWWSKQIPKTAQVRLELVDIWHFALSIFLIDSSGDQEAAAQVVHSAWTSAKVDPLVAGLAMKEPSNLLEKLERIAGVAAFGRFDLTMFRSAADDVGLSFEQLFREYVSKNVLNHFRQDHGYKSGTYTKIWSGKEDNEHLLDVLNSLQVPADQLARALYAELETRYPR